MAWFKWDLRLDDNAAHNPPPPQVSVSLKGRTHSIPLKPAGPPPNTIYMVQTELVPQDHYAIAVVFKQFHDLVGFEAMVKFDGSVVTDPAYGMPFPNAAKDEEAKGASLVYPRDFVSRCFIALDCSQKGIVDIRGAKVGLGDKLLVTGADTTLAPASQLYYRGNVTPGRHALRIEHPRYGLATTINIDCNSTLIVQRINLQPIKPVINHLAIRGAAFAVERNKPLTLTTNLPQEQQGRVQWASLNPAVLRHDGAGRFFGVTLGVVEVTAAVTTPRPMQAKARITVTGVPGATVLRPVDPKAVVSEGGGIVARGELLLRFKGGSAEQQQAVFDRNDLSRVGWIAGSDLHQVEYDVAEMTLDAILKLLADEPFVGTVSPNVMLEYNGSIPPHVPPDLPDSNPSPYWHLVNTEALEAFGLLKSGIARITQNISVMDSGLWLTPAGNEHKDLKGKINLASSRVFGLPEGEADTGLAVLADPDQQKPHGNIIAGIAAALWGNKGAAGIDPTAQVIMIRQHPARAWTAASTFFAGLRHLANSAINNTTSRVVVTSLSTHSWVTRLNAACAPAVNDIILKGGLFIIAAGNQDSPVSSEGLVSIKPYLSDTSAVMVVTGTEFDDVAFSSGRGGPERRWRVRPGEPKDASSNYADKGDRDSVDIAAPARAVLGSDANDSASGHNGTSFAAPMVAGAASLLFSVLPPTTPAQEIKQILIDSGDPIHYTSVRTQLLESEHDKWIGPTRLNIWQALLTALNKVTLPGVKYAGLRASTDRDDLRLSVVYSNGTPEVMPVPAWIAPKTSVQHDPLKTDAMRMSFKGKDGDFPRLLRGEEPRNGTWTSIFEQPLRMTVAEIATLRMRPVFNRFLYTKGGLKLTVPPRAAPLPSNVAAFELENTGQQPSDPDFLDPWSPRLHDMSLRTWMLLINGDAYALKPAPVASGIKIRLLDANRQPLSLPVDDDGNPYVVMPFTTAINPSKPVRLHVEAAFPSDPSAPTEVKADIEIFSLNNHKVTVKHSVVLKAAVILKPILYRPPGWIFIATDEFPPTGGGGAWTWKIAIMPSRWQAAFLTESSLQPPGGDIVIQFGIRFVSPATEAPGTQATVNVVVATPTSAVYRGRFPGVLKLPDVNIVSTVGPQQLVPVPGKQAVKATFPIKLINRSGFDVWVKAIESVDAFLPAFAPPQGVAAASITLAQPNPAWPPDQFQLYDGVPVDATLTIAYHSRLLTDPPEGVVAQPNLTTRRLKLVLVDPLAKTTSPDYRSNEGVVQAIIPPEGRD